MRASYSNFRGPLRFAAVLVLLHSILVIGVALLTASDRDGTRWIVPYVANYPSSLIINPVNDLPLDSPVFLMSAGFLLVGFAHWSIVGFVIGCAFRWGTRWCGRFQGTS